MNELDMIQRDVHKILQRSGIEIDSLVIDLTLYIQNAWVTETIANVARNQAFAETQQELRELKLKYRELEYSYETALSNLALINKIDQEQAETELLFLAQEKVDKNLGV